MQWDDFSLWESSPGPIQRGLIFFIMITFIYVLGHLITNYVRFIYTRKGLKRIENSFKAGDGTDQPFQFKDVELKKGGRFSVVVNAILDTFKELEKLKEKDNFPRLWELKLKSLKDRIEGTFFNRNPFLAVCVLTICLGFSAFAIETIGILQYMPVAGSGGICVITGCMSVALVYTIIASFNIALSALAYLNAKKSAEKISMEITKLEIHLIGRE
jgi:hypothetical protein